MVTRTDGPFEYWEVTGDAVRATAEAPGSDANVIQSLAGELEGDEKRAAEAIEGDITAGVTANPAAAQSVANSLAAKGLYAVGLLKSFAVAVDTFDSTVNQINIDYNARYRSTIYGMQHQPEFRSGEETIDYAGVSASIQADLKGRYQTAEAEIDDAADGVASKFNQGATDENVLELIRAGLIPLTAANLFPDLTISDADKLAYYQNAIANGELPDFTEMSDSEVEAYLADNPQVSDDILALMAAPMLPPALSKLVNAQARVDAALLSTALDDDDPDGATLAQIDKATERLEAINAGIADANGDGKPDRPLTAAQGDYIETWLNTVGADDLAKLPEVVASATPAGMPPNVHDSFVKGHLAPVADAILNYSNPAVHRDDAGIDRAGYQGSTFTPADGHIILSEMPQAIQDLTAMRLGYENEPGSRLGVEPSEHTNTGPRGGQTYETIGDEQFSEILNYDAYSGYADLLSSASDGVEGGADFSAALGDQAIQARQDLNAIVETASDTPIGYEGTTSGRGRGEAIYADLTEFSDGPMSDMLGVTARSEDGSSQLLLNEDNRQSLLAIDWDNSAGATDVITAGTDRDPSGGGDTELQARAAAAIMEDVSEAPEQWGDRMNEAMEDAVLDTGLRWVDTFGVTGDTVGSVTPDGQDVLGRPVGPTIALTDDAKEAFMLFAAGTGDEQAVRFQAGLTHYGDQLIHDALSSVDNPDLSANARADQLKDALTWAGSASGRMETANIQSIVNAMGEENDKQVATAIAQNREIAANKAAATFVTSLASSAAGAIPGAGPFISAGAGAVSGPIIDAIFQEKPIPDFDSFEDNERTRLIDEAIERADASRDYRFAGIVSQQYADDPDYAHLYTPDGQLRPFEDLSGMERTDIGNLGDNLYEDFVRRNGTGHPVSRAETYDAAFGTKIDDAGVNQHEDDPGETPEEREAREQSEREAEDRLRQLLYGDNQSAWDRWNNETPRPQGRYQGPAAPRESPYDTTVGANE